MDFQFKDRYDINDLLRIMDILRSENGCPWDREQDHKSIRKDFIEEVYEAIEAIDSDNAELLKEELGDVLLQVVFHCRIEEEKGSFAFGDAVDGIAYVIESYGIITNKTLLEKAGYSVDDIKSFDDL